MKNVKLATLNLCLGLKNKKDHVKNILVQNQIDILCVQEAEIEKSFNKNLIRIPGFNLELECNSRMSLVGFYISNKIDYRRCDNLEGIDSNLIIIDILGSSTTRIINVYRSFNPQNGISQREKFKYQLSIIKEAFTKGTIILGDFNLDYFKKHSVNYTSSRMFEDFEENFQIWT